MTTSEEQNKPDSGGHRVPRKLAEWVSFGISLAIILGLAGYLVYKTMGDDSPFVVSEAKVLLEQTRLEGGKYIVPVEVTNTGVHTLRELQINFQIARGQGQTDTSEVLIDYLARHSKITIYLYTERDPRSAKIEVKPVHYRLD